MTEGFTEISAKWQGDKSFIARNQAGGAVQMGSIDGKPGVGPMQLLLVAIAGCTGDDILSILQKKQINLADFQVQVTGKRALDYPKIWTNIHITYLIWGNGIQPKDVEKAIDLSINK